MSIRAAQDAARLLLARMGLSPEDLLAAPANWREVPTFSEYIPIVAAAVAFTGEPHLLTRL